MDWKPSEEIREMKYLFIVAHVDDAELAAGGVIASLTKMHTIKVISLSHVYNNVDLFNEFMTSMDSFDVQFFAYDFFVRRFSEQQTYICEAIHKEIMNFAPDVVFTHSATDRHTDHKITGELVARVFSGNLLTFLSPWNGNEDPNYFIEIKEDHLQRKLHALKCYKSQSHRLYMNEEFIRAQARYNGIKCGKLYAEGFKLVRGINFADICTVNRECERMNIAERLKL